MKKVGSYALLALLLISMLSGCSQQNTANQTESEVSEAQMQENSENIETEKMQDTEKIQNTEKIQDTEKNENTEKLSPFEMHGALHVENGKLTDQHGDVVQLYGMSTHGIAWFPQYVNSDAFRTLRDDWNTNCIRLAMYTAENGGYCSGGDKEQLKQLVKDGVSYATDLGMYVIVDWHILSDGDPNQNKDEAIAFFKEMAETFTNNDNVLYEICNEPNGGTSWESIKAYAEEVMPVIREKRPDAVILVGTPTWSQEIDKAAESPLEDKNVMYTLHFYAGTHKDDLRNRLESYAQNGLPIFVSEFGMCDASGNGANDFESTTKWLDLLNKYQISFMCWNLANKDESSSVFRANSTKISDWSEEDLSEAGQWIKAYFKNRKLSIKFHKNTIQKGVPMQSYNDLQSQLKTIDHKSYPLYKSLRGSYQFPKYILSIDHVQGDPFAAPSDVRVTVDTKAAGFPAFAMKDKLTRTALADELLRNFAAKVNQFNFKAKGSGKSGLISVTHCGQEVLQRTACEISEKEITARFAVGFPANGRTINAKELEKILFEYLPQCVEQSFYYKNLNAQKVKEAVELAEDQQAIREKLPELGLAAFGGG